MVGIHDALTDNTTSRFNTGGGIGQWNAFIMQT